MGLACSPASRFSTMLLSLKVFTIRSDRWPGSISPNFPCLRQGFDPLLPRRTIARHPAQASAVGKRSPAARSIRSWFRPTGGFRHPSFGLFSLRCLTSPSAKAPSFIAPLRPAGSLRPFGPGISAVAALSPPLQRSLRFLRHPLPPPPSPSLRSGYRRLAATGRVGLTLLSNGEIRMGRLRPPVRRVTVPPSPMSALDEPTRMPFWLRPISTFGRLMITDLDNGRSLSFSLPSSAGPPPDWCSQMLSPELHTSDCSSACPGSSTWVDKVPSQDTPTLDLADCQGDPDSPQVARNQSR